MISYPIKPDYRYLLLLYRTKYYHSTSYDSNDRKDPDFAQKNTMVRLNGGENPSSLTIVQDGFEHLLNNIGDHVAVCRKLGLLVVIQQHSNLYDRT